MGVPDSWFNLQSRKVERLREIKFLRDVLELSVMMQVRHEIPVSNPSATWDDVIRYHGRDWFAGRGADLLHLYKRQ